MYHYTRTKSQMLHQVYRAVRTCREILWRTEPIQATGGLITAAEFEDSRHTLRTIMYCELPTFWSYEAAG